MLIIKDKVKYNPLKISLIFLLCLGCNRSTTQVAESVDETKIDTIITETEDDEDLGLEEPQSEEAYILHEKYLPQIDSVIAFFTVIDEEKGWLKKDTFDNLDEFKSTEGNELIVLSNSSFTKYILNIYGEMGKSEEAFYLEDNKMILYSTTETRYNAPIYTIDNDSLPVGEVVYDESESELFIEDSYFENDKIVYQACQDCGAPNAREYVRSVEKNVKDKLTVFKKVGK